MLAEVGGGKVGGDLFDPLEMGVVGRGGHSRWSDMELGVRQENWTGGEEGEWKSVIPHLQFLDCRC